MSRFLMVALIVTALARQFGSAQNHNGRLDNLEEFTTMVEVPFTMPDGINLKTNVFLPIVQDCMIVRLNGSVNVFGFNIGIDQNIELIQKGTQIVIYDSLNGSPVTGDDRYKLPMVFTRTPYNKGSNLLEGSIFSIMGYGYAMQDMRGRYASEGVYFPMYSDGWNKNPYHNDFDHIADVTTLSDPRNSNRHEDGYWSVKYITDSLKAPHSTSSPISGKLLCNGSVGMFGASALGNSQLQAASAHKIDPTKPGLKCLFPIVATIEHYNSTGFPNGTFRERIVTGWLKGQLVDLDDPSDLLPLVDNDMDNSLHTAADFGLPNKFIVGEKSIDHFCSERYFGQNAGFYPNSKIRTEMDASHAPVDAQGESVDTDGFTPLSNLNFSRYSNMEVPVYHLTGWWDIYPVGQIETFQNSQKYLSDNLGHKNLQKLVIGPWAHQTVGSKQTGDMKYPDEVVKFNKISFEDIDLDDLPLDELIQSEIVTWFRYNLNHNKHNEIGEPKYIIPESNRWNDIIGSNVQIRLPAEDFVMTLPELFNFLNGTGPIDNIKAEFKFFGQTAKITLPTGFIPPTGDPILEGLEGVSIDQIQTPDFENDIPNVRFWVCGNDSADQANTGKTVGNYWGSSDVFPIDHLTHKTKMFLHADGSLDFNTPTKNEGFLTYVHDPDDPVMTVGGGNMLVNTPQGDRRSQGPMNYADPNFSTFTMKRPGVLSFETESISDSLSIIGYPIATIMAKSNPAGTFDGPTDTDFFVRILDVYPDGREFFVVEGGVNARARDYARSLAHNNPNDNAPISNITSGTLYEYRFRLMPIAHTFGEGHKMKVLISSSNHPRYQSNPNLPIEDGDFFRRYPNDGQGYFYDGQLMYPRVAVQRIAFSNDYGVNSTNIEFPFHVHPWIFTGNEPTRDINVDFDASVFPNPAVDHASILLNRPSKCELIVRDVLGKVLHQDVFQDSYQLDLSSYQNQTYFIQIVDLKTREAIHKKLIVQ